MLVISDVHYALDSLRRVVTSGEPVLILGDLVNLTDYRTGKGALADVLGIDFSPPNRRHFAPPAATTKCERCGPRRSATISTHFEARSETRLPSNT